ncbi:hypothetical protein GcC1_119009 [Golovinomyces cichoracearum]|uniref:Uncharacterized protein n=1 Tax=Golovinomyces cichoracearum TaxID=62708 RepID=A0A420I723_9PEZI|nr:hypothetical protein GcC1_119009 [Golovinomyces cichoracearum]
MCIMSTQNYLLRRIYGLSSSVEMLQLAQMPQERYDLRMPKILVGNVKSTLFQLRKVQIIYRTISRLNGNLPRREIGSLRATVFILAKRFPPQSHALYLLDIIPALYNLWGRKSFTEYASNASSKAPADDPLTEAPPPNPGDSALQQGPASPEPNLITDPKI